MKKVFFFLLGSVAPFCNGNDIEPAKSLSPDTVRVLKYSVVLYCDEACDKEQWDALYAEAMKTIKRGQDDPSDPSEAIDTIIDTLKLVRRESIRGTQNGIHGEISIAMADGKCPEGVCGEQCACLEKYRGVCLCSPQQAPSEAVGACCAH